MCMWGKDLWSGYVEPSNVFGHFGGNAGRERCYLLMDVHKKGVGGPASLFTYGIAWDAIEVHIHGATGAKGVAADARGWETLFVETGGNDSRFEYAVDVACLEAAKAFGLGGVIGADDVVG